VLKVSVVVPVYNAGSYLERCAPSLLQQSMSAEEYEVIYVNDGSTDGSADRIKELRQRYRNVRTVDQPNSGWPGKPRNVGISMARGEYIQFVDQDDELAPEALERLYELGSREGADIVLGKMGGSMAGPNIAFRRNVTGTLNEVPAIETLTGHKMFRREFLLRHGIRFPEGYWRGEDLLFVARCYARAKTVSVLADYTCYFWNRREDAGNSSLAPFDLAGHYERLGLVVGALRQGMEPGELQDKLLRRLYRVETLNRVGEPYILDECKPDRLDAFRYSRALALSGYPPSVREGMPAIQKLRATLLEEGSFEGLQELARRVQPLYPHIERQQISLARDGSLRARLRFWLGKADGEPLLVTKNVNEWLLDPGLAAALPGIADFPVADPLDNAGATLEIEDFDRKVWWYPQGELSPRLEALDDSRYAVVAAGEIKIDPRTAAAGRPLVPGRYQVWFTGQLLGVGRRRRLVAPPSLRARPATWTAVEGTTLEIRLNWSAQGHQLGFEIREQKPALAGPPGPQLPVVASTQKIVTTKPLGQAVARIIRPVLGAAAWRYLRSRLRQR
jgi:poly(ribitol-phosphate) beta-N-acetylglucosaminyltransferase